MNTDRTENFSWPWPLIGLGALILALLSGLLTGCQGVEVSILTKHILPEAQTFTFDVWGAKPGQSVTFTVSPDATWLTVTPDSGTSTGPTNKVRVTVTVAASVPANAAAEITVRPRIGAAKTIAVTTAPNYFTAQYTAGIPLGDTSLLFSPTTDLSGYTQEVQTVMGFLTDPANGALLNFANGCVKVDLSNGKSVSLYGQAYTSVYVNQHGRISFSACVDPVTTLEQHFATRGVSGLSSARALEGGQVSVKQTGDRLAVTFENVPSLGNATAINNFQMELFFNGTVRLTYLDLDASGAIIGLSSGSGLPSDFVDSELDENYNTDALNTK